MTATRVRVQAGEVVCLGLVIVPPRTTLGAESPLRLTKVGRVVGAERVGWRGSPVRGTGSDLSRRARLAPARMSAGCWYKTRSRMLTSRQDAGSAGGLLWSTLHYRLSTWGCVSKCRRSLGLSMSGPSSRFLLFFGDGCMKQTGKAEQVHTLNCLALWIMPPTKARDDLYETGDGDVERSGSSLRRRRDLSLGVA
jgi:hypothetical protein